MTRSNMKAVSDRRRKRDAVYPERRRQVWARANGMCEWCGLRMVGAVHHIAGRGGSDPHRFADDWRDPANNLVGLCVSVGGEVGCHERAHGEPEWARSVGLMRSRHTTGPE
jgi:hypothetical protein